MHRQIREGRTILFGQNAMLRPVSLPPKLLHNTNYKRSANYPYSHLVSAHIKSFVFCSSLHSLYSLAVSLSLSLVSLSVQILLLFDFLCSRIFIFARFCHCPLRLLLLDFGLTRNALSETKRNNNMYDINNTIGINGCSAKAPNNKKLNNKIMKTEKRRICNENNE